MVRFVDSIEDKIQEHFPFRECQGCGHNFLHEDSCVSCGSSNIELSFRDHQREIIIEAAVSLVVDDNDVVVIEGPTGIGKSAINYVLGMIMGSSFYTTPQRSLRNQLQNDDALSEGMKTLRARADYQCGAKPNYNCEECPVNQSSSGSCANTEGCTYWSNKVSSVRSQMAGTTFAYLIVDGFIPHRSPDGGDILSFQKERDLLIVDECHTLEGQVASMFAGFSISPWSVPPEVYGKAKTQIGRKRDPSHHTDVQEILEGVKNRAEQFIEAHEGDESMESVVEDCENYIQKYNYFREEASEGRDWVCNVGEVEHPNFGNEVPKLEMKPIKVDRFLRERVWDRAQKYVLSTATMPYRGDPGKWLDRIGLGDRDFDVIRKPMPFPSDRREINRNYSIDKFSNNGDEENWHEIVQTVKMIAQENPGENGLIHTASYDRAEKLVDDLPAGMAIQDEGKRDKEKLIEDWQKSSAQIVCSPSMMEGVDLKYDICRWQILLKVPYPNGYADNRVSWMLDQGNWDWYYQETGLKVFQSYGRAMRAEDDRMTYYVLDESFDDLLGKTDPPRWILEAL